MRRFRKSLAFVVALAVCLGSNTLFAQNETQTAQKTEEGKGSSEGIVAFDSAASDDKQDDSKSSGDTSSAEDASSSVDDSGKTQDPKAAPQQNTQPAVAANTPPGKFALTFDDLKFDMEKTDTFDREMLTSEINGYHGGKVKIRGYIRPNFKQSGITKFIFVRDNKECCFGPQAAIFDNILVRLERGNSTNYTVRPVTIEGDFVLKEYRGDDGNVWSLYRMYNAKIK